MPSKDDPRKRDFLSHQLAPGQIFILSFAGLILAGAFLLWFPFSSSGEQLNFIDALFTSTSAVCVTGLSVLDIGKDLSFAGQIITILLFQIGGLGIITFSAFLFGIMGRGISFKGREIVQTTFLHTPKRNFLIILKAVLISTLMIESVGIIVLYIRFSQEFPSGTAFYYAVYHAISAFNNCGYSLFSDNLMGYQGDWIINLTIMTLIVIGGIGFVVQHEVVSRFRDRKDKLSIHSKIVIYTTLILIFSGALFFYIFERNHIIKDMQVQSQILVSFFQSITPRTAGFNTVDIGSLQNDTILIMIILMFIGASPGSTGGGIKTTSATLLLLLIWNRWKGYEEVNVFNRTIPKEQITKTISIIFAAALSICLITSILLLAGGGNLAPQQSRHFFVEYLFETVSAFGTVVLSMGITPNMNDIQKLAIIIMMFAGRVGPLTLAFSLALRSARKGITYAEETVMVG
ncbi:MAG: TrkH family potassium uptake protein [Deltaproteobacteria bacterium]|nr:TrkH family potassium uptake protein [Deltaproteobacteria bacterium]